MDHIRTYQDLLDIKPTEAERKLIAACKAGEPCQLGNGSLPASHPADPGREIRADVLRYLILGGCEDCVVDDIGVWLVGATITGKLDLDFTSSHGAIQIWNSRFENRLDMEQAHCQKLALIGSHLAGISGGSMVVAGAVLLRGITSTATINFNGITVGRGFTCEGAQLQAKNNFALVLHSAKIEGVVFLHPKVGSEHHTTDTPFTADGGVMLTASTIGGLYAETTTFIALKNQFALDARNLTITGDVRLAKACFSGELKLTGARIGGDLDCNGTQLNNINGPAFNGERMKVEQSFVWKDVKVSSGETNLSGAHVAELDDDPDNWPDAGKLHLDGFTYDRIRGKVSTSPARNQWLRNGSVYKNQFLPQPYTQYARFLRETGHDSQARRILLMRERLVRKYQRAEFNPLRRAWHWFWDGLQLIVVGHGHAPFWSIGWLALLIALAALPAHYAWEEGSFAPNNGPILISPDWNAYAGTQANPAKVWTGDAEPANWRPQQYSDPWQPHAPGRDWETFNRYAFAADIVIPLISFGQAEAWAPSTTRGSWGWHLWWGRWVFTVLGWIVTALGAAAITGIIRRE